MRADPNSARQRLVAVQEMLRLALRNDVDRGQQSVEVAFLDEGRAEVRHDEVADEHHAEVGKVNEQRVARSRRPPRE